MLNVVSPLSSPRSGGWNRRDFLRVGTLGATSGAGALTLADLLAARAKGATVGPKTGVSRSDTSVIWLWLGGGPTHVETFDPKITAPVEYRSVTGEVATSIPGVTFGGTFPQLAARADRMAIVRSFAHGNSGHGGGTHWVMTGYDDRESDSGAPASRPGFGSILSRARGANHPLTGMPTYVRQGEIYADGAAFLGTAFRPFDPSGDALRNMTIQMTRERVDERRQLLKGLDRIHREVDASGLMEGLEDFEKQAFDLVLNQAPAAFDLSREDPRLVDQYGPGLGERLLRARRLVEAGCGFVTIEYGGWDMHGSIKVGMERISPAMDQGVAALIDDLSQRGLDQRTLLVISGEFGRTPRINGSAGRDHWAPLSTLALAGGGLRMGQVIGESNPKLDAPQTRPVSPQDLMATLFEFLGLDRDVQFSNRAGRPIYMLDGGQPIHELFAGARTA